MSATAIDIVTERPYRQVVGRVVHVVPAATWAIAAAGLLLGASTVVCLVIAAVGAISLFPPVRNRLPNAPRHVIAAWIGVLSLTIPMLAAYPATFGLAAVAGAALIVLARLVSDPGIRRVILAAIIGLQLTGWVVVGHPLEAVWALLGLGVVAVGSEYMSAIHRSITMGSKDRVRALSNERWSLIRLYEIASSIGCSTTMADTLPDLLASVGEALDVRTCAVVRLDPDRRVLTLEGPVWVSGRSIPVDEEIEVPVAQGGYADRALRSSRAIRFDRSTAGPLRSIVAALGLDSGLVAPLRLEGRDSGLLVVGDPAGGQFGPRVIEELTELATPASLVLAQVERHEAALLLAERLQELADMKSDLVSMVSHELRTPLTSVIGSLDILARPEADDDEEFVGEMVQMARRQALRLQRLIDDLLTVSRIDRGLERPEPEPVALADVVADAAWLLSEAPLDVDIPEGMLATVDAHHLSQVVINLVENATKYAPGSPIQVTAEELPDGDVVLAVADHGPGVPADHRGRIFERFVRLPGSKAEGTGLGLAIVSMLVESMHGRIDVLETPGGGATFAVTLPGERRNGMDRPHAA